MAGDARLTLEASSDRYDLIVLDAFSSDTIPVHLLTREALAGYLSRLSPHGVIIAHISNRTSISRRSLPTSRSRTGSRPSCAKTPAPAIS